MRRPDFGIAPIPGLDDNPGRPFIGVSVAYLNRSSPNQDLAKEFLEHYFLTDDALAAMNDAKPIGVPALVSMYQKMSQNDPRLRELKASVDYGQVMPNVPQMGRFFSALGAALQLAADGRLSPRSALLEAAANMRRE